MESTSKNISFNSKTTHELPNF